MSVLEATSISVAPEDTEGMVGDEVILRCAASFDPMLDITFIWAIDFRVIDFNTEWQHYERVMVQINFFFFKLEPLLKKKVETLWKMFIRTECNDFQYSNPPCVIYN